MTATGLRTFDQSLSITKEWLKDIQQELALPDIQQAFVVASAVLHTLRDRLPVNDAVEFAAQLPMFLQGLYYHEWTPTDKPEKIRSKEEFLRIISEEIMNRYPAEDCARAVFKVIQKRMGNGETADIKNILPSEIRDLWPE